MADATTAMDIDDTTTADAFKSNKGKSVALDAKAKATPWVEKYRPQSLDDVAAHRDIVDTSNKPFSYYLQFTSSRSLFTSFVITYLLFWIFYTLLLGFPLI